MKNDLYFKTAYTHSRDVSTKRFAWVILVVTIIVSGLAFSRPGPVHAAPISGTLNSDTHWTLLDSPIDLNGTVFVASGVTLTIDPGVTVNLQSLNIAGTLVAVGNVDQKITFTFRENSPYMGGSIFFSPTSISWSDSSLSGSIIQNVVFNKINLYINSSPKIDSNDFSFSSVQSLISVSGGSPTITNNHIVFTGQDSGHYAYGINVNMGSPVVSYNKFEGNSYLTGLSSNSQASLTVSNNIFSNCWSGIKARGSSVLTVESNSFVGGHDGLDIGEGTSATIRNNLIDSNSEYGINGGGFIDSNTITNNKVGIHNPKAGSVITNNNIVSNRENSITAAGGSVNAQNNWWGITDTPTINQTIYDLHEDPSLGEIVFVPFLYGPNPSAPAIPPNTPTITPIPTSILTPAPIQPTPTPTPIMPTPIPTLTEKTEPILNDSSDLLNLNFLITSVITLLVLVWIVVILGYVAKEGVLRYKIRGRQT